MIYAEGEDERTLRAVQTVLDEGIAVTGNAVLLAEVVVDVRRSPISAASHRLGDMGLNPIQIYEVHRLITNWQAVDAAE